MGIYGNLPVEMEIILREAERKMNELTEENENLKKQLEELEKEIKFLREVIKAFKNEEMKQRVIDLIKGIDPVGMG